MIDFPKFKERMLNLKVQIKAADDFKGQLVAGKIATLAEINALYEEDHNDPSTGWIKKSVFESEGGNVTATIYAKRVEGFDMDFCCFTSEFKDITMDQYRQYGKDWETAMKTSAQYDVVKVVERDSDGWPSLSYIKANMGMLMTSRDCLNKIMMTDTGDTIVMDLEDGDHQEFPLSDDTIRMKYVSKTISQATADGKGSKFKEVSHF